MIQYKVIRVRYLNKDKSLSRPQKLKRITDEKGKVAYYSINSKLGPKYQIDPSTFVTRWEKKPHEQKATSKVDAKWEIIRVKFKPDVDKGGKRTKFSRPVRIYKITSDESVQYAPIGVKGTTRRIQPEEFITEWERAGKTPTPKPLNRCSDQLLTKLGYNVDEIHKLRGRNFNCKDVKLISKRLKIKNSEARDLLIKFNGSKHAIYESIEKKS